MYISKEQAVLIVLGVLVVVLGIVFYMSSFQQKPGQVPKPPTPSKTTISQLSNVVNTTEKKDIKIILSPVENILPNKKTVVFDGERIKEVNLVIFSNQEIPTLDFCKDYSYKILLNGIDKVDYISCETQKINNQTVLLTFKMNQRASLSSYLSIYPSGEPKILGVDELRIG